MPFTYAVALTGSIATGKSTVAGIFSSLGVNIIDADSIAHTVLQEQSVQIEALFGSSVMVENKVNRKALGAIVFSDDGARKKLEALLHPLIYTRIESMAKVLDKKKKPYLVDIPLFYETNRYPIEKVLVVSTTLALQRSRLMQREDFSEEEAQKRIDTQMSIAQKVKKASYVIDNSGTLTALEHACKRVKEVIEKDFR